MDYQAAFPLDLTSLNKDNPDLHASLTAWLAAQHQGIQQLRDQNAQLQAQAQVTPPAPAPAPAPTLCVPELKVSPPPYFDGTKSSECRSFISHCRLNFRGQPSRFVTEDAKVTYAMGYLRGSAFRMVEPSLDETRRQPAWMFPLLYS